MSKYHFFDLTPRVIGAMIIASQERFSSDRIEWIAVRPFTHLMVLSRMQVSPLELEAATLVYTLEPGGTLPILYDSRINSKVRVAIDQLKRFDLNVADHELWRIEQEKRLNFLRHQPNEQVMTFLMALWVTELLEFVWLRHEDWDYYLHQPDIHWLYFSEDLFDIYNMKYKLDSDERPALDEWKYLVRNILGLHLS